MGTPDPIVQSFDQRLQNTVFQFPPAVFNGMDQRFINELGVDGAGRVSTLLINLSQGIGAPTTIGGPNVLPRSWADFLNMAYIAAGSTPPSIAIGGPAYLDFAREFWLSQGVPGLSSQGLDLGTDFPNVVGTSPIAPDEGELFHNLFEAAFAHFIQNYDYNFNSQVPLTAFNDAWMKFLTSTNFISSDSANIPSLQFGGETPSNFVANNLTSYRDLYFAFVPNASQADFTATFTKFFDDQVTQNGYFVASQFAGNWFQLVLQKKLAVTLGGTTGVEGTDSIKLSVIFKLFALLTDMLGTLQKVAATQAQRLTFYANIQQAYTNVMGRIPTITVDNLSGSTFSTDPTTNLNDTNTAQQQISAITQSYTEKLRSYRSMWSDESRSHETAVNQSNETVNQQSNLATALLQEVSSILQGIFR